MLCRFVAPVVATLFFAPALWAQGDPAPESPEASPTDEAGKDAETAPAAEAEPPEAADAAEAKPITDKDEEAIDEAIAGGSPIEKKGKTYYFVGARYRAIIVPKFMINLFGDGGRTVVVHGAGPEFGIRKDGLEYVLSMWFAGYGMDETPFKAKSDPENAWEIVESQLKVLYFTSDFLWSQDFSPEFSINYGLAAGFGIVWGKLFRTQARPPTPGEAASEEDFVKCSGPGDGGSVYCGNDNDHYNNYNEPSWANGGSKPILFPWLALQTGLRFKPHRNFAARLDAGFGTSGFFIGFAANYGL